MHSSLWERPRCARWGIRKLSIATVVAFYTAMLASVVCAEVPPLRFGMSTAISGPAADLGQQMRDGVLAAFAEANAAGGIQGRALELIVLDDGYEPARTVPNMHALIEEHQVLAIVGNVGTPTAIAAIPIATRSKTLFYGAFTGAGALRKTPPDRYVINFRASYVEETAAMVDALVQHGVAPPEIGFFTQRDGYGDAGFDGGMLALNGHGVHRKDVAHGRYNRNTSDVEAGLADLMLHEPPPKAVVMVGAYAPCAKFIRTSLEVGFRPQFLNVSFVGTTSLIDALGPDSEGVVITQVVPHYDAPLPVANDYRGALQASYPDLQASFGSFEGYIAARLLIRGVQSVDGPVTRESLVEALEQLGDVDLGLGTTLHLSKDEHQACHRVWPTVVRNGKAIALKWDAPAESAVEASDE
jgi:ABC-type branched-subunit amino acid transport system substrate-binding protein